MKKLLAILALTLSAGMAVGQVTEDFESGTKTAYAAADVTLGSGTWTLTDALLGTTASDRFNGTKSVRLRNGSLTMKFNASTAGTVSVYHALYGSDASQTWKLQQSIDDGANWTDVGSAVTTSSTSLAQVSFVVDLNSPVRFQIVKTSGGTTRINIDDFSITAFGANTAPSITDVARTAYIPEPVDNLTVTSTITDNGSISAAYLRYTINGGEIDSSLATNTSGSSYSATISSELISDGDFVVYSYSALDNLGAYSKSTDSKVFVGTTSISTLRVNDMNGLNVYNNSVARIVGTASFPNGVTSATNMDWYLQDESAGINIFKFGDASFPVEIGTKYTVSGVVTPFNGRLEIVPSSTSNIVNSGSGILPDPTTVVVPSVAGFLASPEDYEGELASFKNVQISSGTWPATSTFVTTLLVSDDGGVNSIALYINTTTGGIEQVGTFDVVGIIRQDDNTSPFNAAYQIVPRSADDFYPANTLPVELASFTASAFGSGAKLVWSTKTEQNNAGFEVERKTTGNWTSLGFVAGKGTTNNPQSYSFIDAAVSGKASYRLKQVDTDGAFSYSPVVEFTGTPATFEVLGNYPNPFNPATVIKFNLPAEMQVTVSVFNVLGQRVAELVNGKLTAGEKSVSFNAAGLSSGVYIYRIQAGNQTVTRSMLLTK